MEYAGIRGLVDIRDQLHRRADGGPARNVALVEKRGLWCITRGLRWISVGRCWRSCKVKRCTM